MEELPGRIHLGDDRVCQDERISRRGVIGIAMENVLNELAGKSPREHDFVGFHAHGIYLIMFGDVQGEAGCSPPALYTGSLMELCIL